MKITPLLLLSLLAWAGPLPAAEPSKPNILILLADDMGYSDVGCYGGEIQTPNLDRLAAHGLRFTQFYNTARCWSSRASIMTGYYAQSVRRDGFTGHFAVNTGGVGVRPRWAELLPALLRPQGYRTYHSGKWHIDGQPLDNGFDHSYLEMNDFGYFTQTKATEDDVPVPNIPVGAGYYNTIAVADYAIKYLKEHAAKYSDRPFFEYVAFHSPHFPIQALPQDIALYQDTYKAGWDVIRQERIARMKRLGILDTNCNLSPLDPVTVPHWNLPETELQKRIGPDEVGHAVAWNSLTAGQKTFQASKMSVHAAMVHRMDIEIGRILDQLKAMGAFDNTLIFFLSDNGASAEQIIRGLGEDPKAPVGSAYSFLGIGPGWASAANTPFRLYKSWEFEGGNCTPLIVHWPAGISTHGELRENPGHMIDIVPTVLNVTGGQQPTTVAGLAVPPLPGKSLVPAFTKDHTVSHDFLWFEHDGNRAIRIGDWKLVADHAKLWELYDLAHDRSETKNLAAQYPDKVKTMEQAWITREQELHALAEQDPPPGGFSKKPAKAKKPAAAKAEVD